MTMTTDEIKATALQALIEVAPEVDAGTLDERVSFRDQFEMDSVDYLNFVLALEQKLSIKVPELDYPKLSNLEGCVSYLRSRIEG
jgi:acyl carrier protein